MNKINRPFDWANILFITLTPLAAILWAAYYIPRYGVTTLELGLFAFFYIATGLGITAGYHRHFSHVSYQSHPVVRFIYLIFGACAMQNSALHWATDHRLHHRYTDTDRDPYNAKRGFFWSHMGWIFYKSQASRDFSLCADLMADKWVMWQHRNSVAIGLIVGFGVPLLIGLAVGRPGGAVLWGGLIRVVFVHHATFLINSAAHIWGRQPFSRTDTSRDNTLMAFLTYGEGFHNFHHKFPSDYRNGVRWYQWDPSKWLIAGAEKLGLASNLHRMPDYLILRARLETEALDAEKHVETLPSELKSNWKAKLAHARTSWDHALTQWGESVHRYKEAKKAALPDREEILKRAKVGIEQCRQGFAEAREGWKASLQQLYRQPV